MVKMRHYKEVMTEILPKLIQYKIPLHLPQEQLAFGAESLVVSIRVPVPQKINLESLKTRPELEKKVFVDWPSETAVASVLK